MCLDRAADRTEMVHVIMKVCEVMVLEGDFTECSNNLSHPATIGRLKEHFAFWLISFFCWELDETIDKVPFSQQLVNLFEDRKQGKKKLARLFSLFA